ncbi:Uncharacterised protein [uncultured Eubacterium sp.]|nr:Uncharacterised protein [uncultured Eubacterium sp.]
MKKGMEIMKKTLAILLSVLMVVCMMPGMAFAGDLTTGDITNATIELTSTTTEYTGSEITLPTATVKIGDSVVSTSKYNLAWTYNNEAVEKATAAGVYTLTITGTDSDASTGVTGSKTATFTVSKKSIVGAVTVSLSNNSVTYNQNEQKPEVTVTKTGKTDTLTENTDYTLTWSKTPLKAAGKYEVTVKGIGNYDGEIKKEYTIKENFSAEFRTTYSAYHVYQEGNEIKPSLGEFIIKDSTGKEIGSNEYAYFTITGYRDNKDAGTSTPKAVITANSNYAKYSGSVDTSFTINRRNLENERYYVTVDIPNQRTTTGFDGVTVYYNKKLLQKYTDYTITDSNPNSSSSSRAAKITFNGNYSGTITQSYTYSPNAIDLSIANTYVYMYPGYAYYNGAKVEMSNFTVTCNNRTLTKGYDYDVKYENNDRVGTATAIIYGKGAYVGTVRQTFQIYAGKMSDCTINFIGSSSYPYTGTAIRPPVTVKCGSVTLPTSDYTVTYLNNTATGTATVRVSGNGNFTGYKEATFTIYGTDINTCTATLSQDIYNYTGRANTPTVTVKKGITTLTLNRDYTVKYEDNTKAGTGKVIITGKGAYSGTLTKEFTIIGKDNAVKTNYTRYTKYIGSDSFNLGAKQSGEGYIKYTSDDTSVATVSPTGVVSIVGTGKAAIKVETVGTVTYNPAYKYVYVTVKPNKPVIKVTSPSKGKVKVLITKVKGATKYQVKYGRNDKYYNKYITHKENEYTKTSTTIKNRKSGVYYYVQVRAYKTLDNGDKVWGNWTTLRKVRAK